jgi:predicted TIM-barrel fold metal-dependent hydrolase
VRLTGGGTRRHIQHAHETIRRCFEEYGFLGVKFNGAQDDYVIDDERLVLPCIEYAARYGGGWVSGRASPSLTLPFKNLAATER